MGRELRRSAFLSSRVLEQFCENGCDRVIDRLFEIKPHKRVLVVMATNCCNEFRFIDQIDRDFGPEGTGCTFRKEDHRGVILVLFYHALLDNGLPQAAFLKSLDKFLTG